MNKINTIADLKLDIFIYLWAIPFKDFIYYNFNKNNSNSSFYNEILIEYQNKYIKNGNYLFTIYLKDITENFMISSKNLKLDHFLYSVYLEISKLVDIYDDPRSFLEGFKRVNDFEYEVILG